MGITLDEVLLLAGRLDDGGRFDTPRERFRRFLSEQDPSNQLGRALIDQCPSLVDEQHHRALQDLVVFLGRLLGFETAFGTYGPATGGLKHDGHWRSRARLDVVLELRTNYTSAFDLEDLARSVAAHAEGVTRPTPTRAIGLAVVTPGYAARRRLEESLAAGELDAKIRILTLRSLLFLADSVRGSRLTHDDVVRLLDTVPSPDFVVGLFEKLAQANEPDFVDLSSVSHDTHLAPQFWLATVEGDSAITAEQFLAVVVGKRRIFGVRGAGHPSGAVRAGDRICFYLADRGAVGRAWVKSIEAKASGLRDVQQYSQLLTLDDVELHADAPVSPDAETMLRLRATQGDGSAKWHPLMRISAQVFEALTKRGALEASVGGQAVREEAAPKRGATPRNLTDGGSRSPE